MMQTMIEIAMTKSLHVDILFIIMVALLSDSL